MLQFFSILLLLAQLQAAASTPLFSGSRSSYTPRERFPNVYDKMEEARHASAFIGGVKVCSNSSLSYYYKPSYRQQQALPCSLVQELSHSEKDSLMCMIRWRKLDMPQPLLEESRYVATSVYLTITSPVTSCSQHPIVLWFKIIVHTQRKIPQCV